MLEFVVKVIVSALVIAGVSELAKRFVPIAAILASLPLTSILAMIWLYRETNDVERISSLSTGIFWAVLPSLLFFLVLPLLLKSGIRFPWALLLSSGAMFLGYTVYVFLLGRLGIRV
jgi:hypothetical protein